MSIIAFAFLLTCTVGQAVSGADPDSVSIHSGRPKPTTWLKFNNGTSMVTGSFDAVHNRMHLLTIQRRLYLGDLSLPLADRRQIELSSSVTEIERGTVLPVGNLLLQILDGDQLQTLGRRASEMEYESLAKKLGDGINVSLPGKLRLGKDDTFELEAIEIHRHSQTATFSGRTIHRTGDPAKVDADATGVVKDCKVGDLIQMADIKLKVLHIVPPNKMLRVRGWVAFELP